MNRESPEGIRDSFSFPLKIHLERKLHRSIVDDRRGDPACRRRIKILIRESEAGMVEQVERTDDRANLGRISPKKRRRGHDGGCFLEPPDWVFLFERLFVRVHPCCSVALIRVVRCSSVALIRVHPC